MSKWLVRILLIAVVAGPALGMAWWWRSYWAGEVETHTVSTGRLLAGVTVSGTVRCVEKTAVAAEVVAAVAEVVVDEGDPVQQGQVLLRLDDRIVAAQCLKANNEVRKARQYFEELKEGPRKAEIEQAQHAVDQAQAAFRFAKKEYDQVTQMLGEGGATQSELDRATRELAIAQGALGQARARLSLLNAGTRAEQIARAQLEIQLAEAEAKRCQALRTKYTLRAPHDGKVTAKYINPGEVISPGQVLLRIDNTDKVEIRAAAQETQLPGITVGAEAEIVADAYPDTPLTAVVDRILPRVAEETGTVTVLLHLNEDPPVEMMDGMAVDVALLREKKDQVVRVPVNAVVGRGDQAFVWVRKGGSYVRRDVTVGLADGRWMEITQGLQPGDVVRLP